jgi:hypothetical protein
MGGEGDRFPDMTPISYRQVLRLPNVFAVLLATGLSRLASRMFSLAIVLHALATFGSPAIAGWISFAAIAPGLAISPLAGAFLDRAGAATGIAVDLAASAILVVSLAILIAHGMGSREVMLVVAAGYALTSPLSAAGIRVLLPRLVPVAALDRVNALDTAIHAMVDVVGPSFAGVLMGFAGSTATFLAIAAAYAAATICVGLARVPPVLVSHATSIPRQAIQGVAYVFRRPLLRGLAAGYALNQVTWGILVVGVPVLLARGLGAGTWETASGLLWAAVGVAGGIGALAAGHLRVLRREVKVMTLGMAVTALAVWPLAAEGGMIGLVLGLALAGLLAGPIDVGVLTLRQRRTDPDHLGRVLAVSMSLNMSGYPAGMAFGGMLVAYSTHVAFVAAAMAAALAAVVTHALIPAEDTRSTSSMTSRW